MIILDTDALTFLERRENEVSVVLRRRLTELSAEHEIVTTVISNEEQTRGWFTVLARSRSADAQVIAYDRVLTHLETFRTIKTIRYSREAAVRFDMLRAGKVRIGTADLKIAAVALAHGAKLLTRNLRDFSQVAGLSYEDWTRG